ncbi:MAG: PD40 domain-containing protein [Anaerolineae bacterium]|nr:PD40 domain-containing protein [Anaerolineae bacterium]
MKTIRYLILFIISLTLGCWWLMSVTHNQRIALAQNNNSDTVLAEATLDSFLTSLTLNTNNKAKLAKFYLTDEMTRAEIVQTLISESFVDYKIIEGQWLHPGTYQSTVKLSPGERFIIVTVQKLNSRYRIVNLVYSEAPQQPQATAVVSPTLASVSAPTPVPLITGTLILQPQTGGDFYLVEAGGSGLRRLTSGIDPALSPDSAKVAFTRWDGAGLGTLLAYDLTSGEEKIILDSIAYQPKAPAWSPDGAEIVINYQVGQPYTIEQCGDPLPHLNDPGREREEVCHRLPMQSYWRLRRVKVETGSFEDLPSATHSFSPNWDPANPWRIVFFDLHTGLGQLDLNRGELITPLFTNPRVHAPVFSPDGRKIAVTYHHDKFWAIYIINAADNTLDDLGRIAVPGERYSDASPAWSPNGEQITFVTNRTGRWEFWLMNADGSDSHPLLLANVAAQLEVRYQGMDERLISWGN